LSDEKDIRTYTEVLSIFEKRSTCAKRKVAAIIVRGGRIVSTGWNGVPSGMKHCCDVFSPEDIAEDPSEHHLYQNQYEIHAEANAIGFAARHGVSTDGCDIYISCSPCYSCAKTIVASGIKRVFYRDKYDYDSAAVEFLERCGVKCILVQI